MKKKEITIPTLVGLLVVVGGLVTGLWLVQRQIYQSSKAALEISPKEVVVANVTENSFTVTWTTSKAVVGFVQYGEANANQDLLVSDDRDQQKGSVESYFTHFVTIKGLKPDILYKFKIGSDNQKFSQGGADYEIRTGPILSQSPPADVAYGQVVTTNGEPAYGALVYLTIPGGNIQATLTKPSGSWVIPLSTIRNSSLDSYVQYDKALTRVEVSVNDGPMGTAKIVTLTGNDNPTPQIILGQDKNYTNNLPPDTELEQTSAQEGSKFGLVPTMVPEITDLKILSPQPGEAVNSSRPEIIGVAPANAEVTIEIHSEATVTRKVTADSKGKFSFSVPTNLPPGEHKVTISTIIDGGIRRVTRSFTVYAVGENSDPAFSATPSGTISPRLTPTKTPSPTPTPRPSATIRPTATLTPTATPRPSATIKPSATVVPTSTIKPTVPVTPTPVPTVKPSPTPKPQDTLPESGGTVTTWLLSFLGLGMILSGWWWYKKAV